MRQIESIIDFLFLLKLRSLGNVPYQNIFLVGILVGLFGFNKLERNWIPMELIVGITIVSCVGVTILFWKFYKREFGLIWGFFHNLAYGFLIAFFFMLSNDVLSNRPEITKQYHIKDLKLLNTGGNKGGNRMKPEFIVEIDGKDRVFTVHYSRFKQFVNTRKAYLTIKEGFWGYKIVTSLKFEDET